MLNIHTISPYVRAAVISLLKPGGLIKKRALFDYELIWFVEGGFDLSMDGKNYRFKQNDIILIPPGRNHTITVPADGEAPLHAHIHFDFIYTDKSPMANVSYKPLELFTEDEKTLIQPDFFENELDYPCFNISNRKKITSSMEEVIRLWHGKPMLYALSCKELMTGVIRSIILDNIPETRSVTIGDDNDFIGNIKRFVDSNYLNSKLSLDMIADQFHYNKYYIAKKFSSTYGVSLIKYCNMLRTQYAQKKLADGLSPTSVSELLFFPDVYSFSRFFKTQYGISPSAYQEDIRRKGKKQELMNI